MEGADDGDAQVVDGGDGGDVDDDDGDGDGDSDDSNDSDVYDGDA